MLPYCPDPPLEPPEAKTNPQICGMLEAVDNLEDKLKALREEKDIFLETLYGMQHLSFDSRDIIRDAFITDYDSKIDHHMDELAAIKSHLAELGYAA